MAVAVASASGASASRDYRVVYRGRVAVRAERSLQSEVVGTQRFGDVLQMVAINGRWLRLAPKECQRLQVREAWMLMDGKKQGFGPLLEPVEKEVVTPDVARPPSATSGMQASSPTGDWVISIGVQEEFEECIEIQWRIEPAPGVDRRPPKVAQTVIEMVIDRSEPGSQAPERPPKDAMVKRVPCESGKEQAQLCMPSGRRFLVSVLGSLPGGGEVRSPWIQAKTLSERTRTKGLGNLDPVGKTRLACLVCSCSGYIMTTWSANSRNKGRCRRCGCGFEDHQAGGTTRLSPEVLEEMTQEFQRKHPGAEPPPLPSDAGCWTPQEVDLWLRTEGLFHPRRTKGEHRSASASEGSTRLAGKPGRVSVIVPTTESRQSFHSSLWACFEAQSWSDKELVVVETYVSSPSTVLAQRAQKDPRLTYVAFERAVGKDWSIGLKRNICAQLTTGEFIAHFDDDDLYAPAYLSTLVSALQKPKVEGVKLASWFIFDKDRGVFAHCDPVECGKQDNKDETDEWIRKWLYGYGFSYVYRRQAAMECPYRDLNLGEDFEFFSSLMEMKGHGSIVLLHDDAGICLHLQHGRNTSDTHHLVDHMLVREEVSDLEVADLHPVFDEYMRRFPKKKRPKPEKDKAKPESQLRRRLRSVTVHTSAGGANVECWTGATAAELLSRLEEQIGMLPLSAEVCWVPPVEQAPEAERRRRAAEVLRLGVAQTERLRQAESLDAVDPEVADRIRTTMSPVPLSERIGAKTSEVWLRLPELRPDGRSDDHVRVSTNQETLVPRSVSRVFHVFLFAGAKIADLRNALQPGLPSDASVLVLKSSTLGGTDWVELEDWDMVPDKVRVSRFEAQITPEIVLRFGQCLEVYSKMLAIVARPDVQALFDSFQVEAEGDDRVYRAFLLQFLSEKLYPSIGPCFGFPDGNEFLQSFVKAIQVHMNYDLDLKMHWAWFGVETAMRNGMNVESATRWLKAGGVWNLGGTGSANAG